MKYLLTLIAVVAMAGSAAAQIDGSAHDFFGASWNTTGEICVPCHTPHNADISVSDAPLWNHELSSATYTTYTGLDLQGSIGAPDGVSKLCLSCHDGTIGVDNFGGTTGGTTNTITGAANLGTTLADDHPISITYVPGTGSGQDAELHPTTNTLPSGSAGSTVADLLFSNKVECASCHDVHNGGPSAAGSLLRVDNSGTTGSELCLSCHDK